MYEENIKNEEYNKEEYNKEGTTMKIKVRKELV
jgi:hypothetical protein